MWKFQCKKQLGVILVGFIFGAILFGAFGYQRELILDLMNKMSMAQLSKEAYIPYLLGGITIAGAVNGFMLTMYFIQRFNINYMFVIIIFFFGGFSFIAPIGAILLLPTVAVCIFGWLTIPNRGNHKALEKNEVTSVAEVERVYRLHHRYVNDYDDLAKKVWNYTLRMNVVYAVGLIVMFFAIFYVEDLFLMFLVFVCYAVMFIQLTKRKAMALEPIIALLYDECNPEACASAIFALAKFSKKKKTFPLPQHLAQCMIYLNDPHLAVDVLVTCQKDKVANMFPYYSLMAYAYYQLGDASMVQLQFDECEKNSARNVNGPIGMLRSQCLDGISNKLEIMNKEFGKARRYFEANVNTTPYEFQKVDFHYYLGLIAFVDHDLDEAQRKFDYVKQHGNQMYFVEKANKFLQMIANAAPEDTY
ncbi:MAG: hypothetical protein RR890_03070 [Longicatena sp.]